MSIENDHIDEVKLYETNILKLRSGETIVAKVLIGEKSSAHLTIEEPMEIIITTSTNDLPGMMRDIAFLRRWMSYTDRKTFSIPVDWVAMVLEPNDRILDLYNKEIHRLQELEIKNKDNPTNWSAKKVSDLIKEQQEELDLENQLNQEGIGDGVQVSFNMPPEIFMKLLNRFQGKQNNGESYDEEIDWNDDDEDSEDNRETFRDNTPPDNNDPDNFDDYPKGKDDWF